MIEEIKNIKSGRRELRQFGITIGVVACLVGIWFAWREKEWYNYFFIVTGFLIFCAFVLPGILKPFQKVWMTLSLLMGWVVTRVILIALFYLLVTPIGLLARLCGKEFLHRKFDRKRPSYWIPRKTVVFDKKHYENQF